MSDGKDFNNIFSNDSSRNVRPPLDNISSSNWSPIIPPSSLKSERNASRGQRTTLDERYVPYGKGQSASYANPKASRNTKTSNNTKNINTPASRKKKSEDGLPEYIPYAPSYERKPKSDEVQYPKRETKKSAPPASKKDDKLQFSEIAAFVLTGGKKTYFGKKKKRKSIQPKKSEPKKSSALTNREKEEIKRSNFAYEQGRREGKNSAEISRKDREKRIRKRKTYTLAFVACFLVMLAVGFGAYVFNSVALVNTITVEGESSYKAQSIIEKTGIKKGDKLLAINTGKLSRELTVSMPYLKTVKIKRKLPDEVTIYVTRTSDRLVLINGKNYVRVDVDGKILSATKSKSKNGVFEVHGIEFKSGNVGDVFSPGIPVDTTEMDEDEKTVVENQIKLNQRKYEAVKEIVSACLKSGNILTGVIDIRDINNIIMVYDSRVRLYIGNTELISKKISTASAIMYTAVPENGKGYIDLEYDIKGAYFKPGSMTK